MQENAVAEYRKKLDSAEKQQVQTAVRIHAISELRFRIISLEKANDVIEQVRSFPETGTKLAMNYVTELLDGKLEGYETAEELVSAFKKAQTEHPDIWDAVIATMNEIKAHNSYSSIAEYSEDVVKFIGAVMQFFIIERESLFPLSKGGRNEESN